MTLVFVHDTTIKSPSILIAAIYPEKLIAGILFTGKITAALRACAELLRRSMGSEAYSRLNGLHRKPAAASRGSAPAAIEDKAL